MEGDDWAWSFLHPWCQPACGRLRYVNGLLEDAPGQSFRGLQVQLPSSEFADADVKSSMGELRDALGLLAAVAHVDNAAWKRLLVDYVRVDVDSQEEMFEGEFPPRFKLALIDDGPDSEGDLLSGLDAFCSTEQHSTHGVEFEEALTRIAAQAGEKRFTGSTEIEVPVTIQLGPWLTSSSDGMLTYLRSVQEKVRAIRTQWQSYLDRNEAPLSVTFVLETLLADLRDVSISAELAEVMESFASDGIRFSGLTLRQELDQSLMYNGSQAVAREVVGRHVWSLFCGAKHVEAPAADWGEFDFEATTMTGPLAAAYGHFDQLALSSVHFDCETMQSWVFERICSAVAVNQTATHLSLGLELDDGEDSDDGDWDLCRWRWKWIIFACFSEKARLHSRLESLTLRNAVITDDAVEAMAEVLATDAPEEVLLGCASFSSDTSTDIGIMANSPIRLRPMHPEEAPNNTFRVVKELNGVRLLSEPDENDWVDVLIPGFGTCRVQQTNLIYRETKLPPNGLAGITSLAIKFGEDPDPDVLLALLTLVGASLAYLTLEFEYFNTRELEGIVASCPNLIELAVCTPAIEMRFSLRDSNYRDLVLYDAAHLSFDDIGGIAEALSDNESPFTKCARRLRVRMGFRASSYLSEDWFGTLLSTLEANSTLEYLDVVTGRPHMTFFNDFKAHHLESLPVVESVVPIECKTAFLSVMNSRDDEDLGNKKRKHQVPLPVLDQHTLEFIFEYAAAHVIRRVYFRQYDFFTTGRYYMPI